MYKLGHREYFYFWVVTNVSHFSSQYAPDDSLGTSFNSFSTEDKSPGLEKLKEARLNYPKNPLIAYLNINSFTCLQTI